jgi:hypothetical protein
MKRHRAYLDGMPVTQYSPCVFDTIANRTLVSFILSHASKYDSMTARAQLWGRVLRGLDPNIAIATNLEPFDNGVFSPTLRTRLTVLRVSSPRLSLSRSAKPPLRRPWPRHCVITPMRSPRQQLQMGKMCLTRTPLEDLYGDNLPGLRAIKHAVDPENVMGLAGGFKL